MINVRHPDLERNRGDFEAKPDEHKQHADEENFIGLELRRDRRKFVEIQFARRSPHQRNAEHEKCRRQRAENQIFHAGFERNQPPALKTRQHVKCDGNQFDGNKEHHKIVGRRRKQHSRQRENDERIVFTDACGNAARLGEAWVGKFHRHEQHQNRGDKEVSFKKDRQRIFHKHAVKCRAGGCNCRSRSSLHEQQSQRRYRRVTQEALVSGGHPKIRQQQHEAKCHFTEISKLIKEAFINFGLRISDLPVEKVFSFQFSVSRLVAAGRLNT